MYVYNEEKLDVTVNFEVKNGGKSDPTRYGGNNVKMIMLCSGTVRVHLDLLDYPFDTCDVPVILRSGYASHDTESIIPEFILVPGGTLPWGSCFCGV